MPSRLRLVCTLVILCAAGSVAPATTQTPTTEPRHSGHEVTHEAGEAHRKDQDHQPDEHGDMAHDSDRHAKNHDGMKHSFADTERWSEVFDAADRDQWQRPQEVIDLMRITPGMTVADIGAGTGYFLGPLAAAVGVGGSVLGLEVEPAMVQHIQLRAQESGWANVAARLIAADDPGLAHQSADRILIVNTWHHIGSRGAYSARLRSALSEGGELVIVDYTLDSEHGPPKEFRLPPEQILAELREGGLDGRVVNETLPLQFVIVARPAGQ